MRHFRFQQCRSRDPQFCQQALAVLSLWHSHSFNPPRVEPAVPPVLELEAGFFDRWNSVELKQKLHRASVFLEILLPCWMLGNCPNVPTKDSAGSKNYQVGQLVPFLLEKDDVPNQRWFLTQVTSSFFLKLLQTTLLKDFKLVKKTHGTPTIAEPALTLWYEAHTFFQQRRRPQRRNLMQKLVGDSPDFGHHDFRVIYLFWGGPASDRALCCF